MASTSELSESRDIDQFNVVVTGDVELSWFSHSEQYPGPIGDGNQKMGWSYFKQHHFFPKLGGAWQQVKSIHHALKDEHGNINIKTYSPEWSNEFITNKKIVHTFYSIKLETPASDEIPHYEDCLFLREYRRRFKIKDLLGYMGPDNGLSEDIYDHYCEYCKESNCGDGIEIPSTEHIQSSFRHKVPANDVPNADLMVIDDAGYGFSDDVGSNNYLKKHIKSSAAIIYRMRNRLVAGPLWNIIAHDDTYLNKTILILRADDLRSNGINISRRLSHERSAADLCSVFKDNALLKRFSNCAFVIVRFGVDSAILFYRTGSTRQARIYFNPNLGEDAYTQSHHGHMLGVGNVFIAALVKEIIAHKSKRGGLSNAENLDLAVKRGVHEALLSTCVGGKIKYTEIGQLKCTTSQAV